MTNQQYLQRARDAIEEGCNKSDERVERAHVKEEEKKVSSPLSSLSRDISLQPSPSTSSSPFAGDKSDKSDERSPALCEQCGKDLVLPESQILGRCFGCQTEDEHVTTLASMALRRERTKRAVQGAKAKMEQEILG